MGRTCSIMPSRNRIFTGRITKLGNKRLRVCLVQVVQVATRFDPKLKPFYDKIKKNSGPQKTKVTVTRKILVSIYYVLIHNEEYHG